MRPAALPLLLLLLAAAHATHAAHDAHDDPATHVTPATDDASPTTTLPDVAIAQDHKNDTVDTITLANGTVIQIDPANSTPDETGDEHEPVVRKKRTFGDIVFRGLADVLGYAVQRRPPQAATFPPPVAPVPGIDAPLQAAPAPAAPPCGAPRAAAPPPCRAQRPPRPKPAPPPCPQPRAVPKPRPPPPPPPPPPCAKPRANPATPAPCAPAPPPPKQQADPNLETISSNFQLNFNFARNTAAPPAAEADDDQGLVPPIAIEPRAAKLPLTEPRQPRVYVDAFVVRNGVPQKVNTVDAKAFNSQLAAAEGDYLAYDEEEAQQPDDDDDDYEDVQESRDQAVKEFGAAVNRFWQKKRKQATVPPPEHYQTVHFGDRALTNQLRRNDGRESHQNLQRNNANTNTIHLPLPEADDESEVTTTTEDPRRPLKPRVLPPTEHNPGQIDTVTVRVPPIYREKRPRKYNQGRPDRPDRDEYGSHEAEDQGSQSYHHEADTDSEDSVPFYRTEAPIKRRRRRKQNRKTRSIEEEEPAEKTKNSDVDVFLGEDYDYFGRKQKISKEEEFFRGLTIPPPTKDADLARIEEGVEYEKNGHFLSDHERLREDPERTDDSGRFDKSIRNSGRSGKSDDSDKKRSSKENKRSEKYRVDASEGAEYEKNGHFLDDHERLREDPERTDDSGRFDKSIRNSRRSGKSDSEKKRSSKENKRSEKLRADSSERSDRLSPNARIHEIGYRNNYVRANNVQVEDPRPPAAP